MTVITQSSTSCLSSWGTNLLYTYAVIKISFIQSFQVGVMILGWEYGIIHEYQTFFTPFTHHKRPIYFSLNIIEEIKKGNIQNILGTICHYLVIVINSVCYTHNTDYSMRHSKNARFWEFNDFEWNFISQKLKTFQNE